MYDISMLSSGFYAPLNISTYEPIPRPLRQNPATLIEAIASMSIPEREELLLESGACTLHATSAWDTMLELIDPARDFCEGFFVMGKRLRVCFVGGCVDVWDNNAK